MVHESRTRDLARIYLSIVLSLLGVVIIYAFVVLLLLMWNKEKIK